ncbi:GTP cyclohydrolase II [Oceanospirillum multiglobuliferum]|uniref:GTP cyclohydrolase-2 n=1 Tax=Oceanospirillum multiglobuliferum TaxID=64969 RepID=A0A1T4NKS4_9GAMM|nr:GTP cyclohydrolase II [Oceanospirillum multiglobuliferum]OPX55770.1 GTP cyclohydrolase II [Oceanospirillum multiglobuliferum]SJZ79735.1 GTP cyclohydrolase II [Oceanospirillum multiglobuliferum]
MSVNFIATSRLPTPWGVFNMHGFEELETGKDHVALSMGDIANGEPVLARVHSECLTGDALFSLRCDCGYQLQEALKRIAAEGRGVLLYLRQEGRGIGLLNKVKAYALQDAGADTVEANEALGFGADMREYSMCQPMLAHIGVQSVRLMTNNPRKVDALTQFGVTVVSREPIQTGMNPHNENYLATKAGKLGHMMDLDAFTQASDVEIERTK